MKFSYSKIFEYEGSKERFLTLLTNKMKNSSMKSKIYIDIEKRDIIQISNELKNDRIFQNKGRI